jgi:hypothetical protein
VLLRNSVTIALIGLFSISRGQVPERQARWNQDLAIFAGEFPSHQMDDCL